jgi:hypothetical protein
VTTHPVSKLVGNSGGTWVVRSEAVAYIFDLDRMLVCQFIGPDPDALIIDAWDSLLGIRCCETGHLGDWTTDRDVLGSDSVIRRQDTAPIVDITRVVGAGTDPPQAVVVVRPAVVNRVEVVARELIRAGELLGGEGGVWTVFTRDSHYLLDLDEGTVQRFAGPISNPGANDVRRRIRDISSCRVGARGRWTMFAAAEGDPDVEYMWQHTSEIRSIEREDADDANR